MTHYAVIWIFGNYYRLHHTDAAHLALIVTSGVLVMLGFAYLVMVLYNTPVRKYLSSRRRAKAIEQGVLSRSLDVALQRSIWLDREHF